MPYELKCGNPAHFGFTSINEPTQFREKFSLQFLQWFYKNHPEGTEEPKSMIEGTDICMPLLWAEEPSLLAYSKKGRNRWSLPAGWREKKKLSLLRLSVEEPVEAGNVEVQDGEFTFEVESNGAYRITSV